MDIILFGQDEKIIQYNDGVFKRFDINQSESRINYGEVFVYFFEALIIHFRIELSITVIFVVLTNQNEVFTYFKKIYRSEQN